MASDDYWQGIATDYLQSMQVFQRRLEKLDELMDELRWGNAATNSRDFGRGVAYVVDKVLAVLAETA